MINQNPTSPHAVYLLDCSIAEEEAIIYGPLSSSYRVPAGISVIELPAFRLAVKSATVEVKFCIHCLMSAIIGSQLT